MSHCTPAIKTKLKSLSGWEKANDDQNGIELVKLLHSIHFEQDGSKQSMLEIVTATKKLFLCYQRESWDLDYYTREFNARAQVCKEAGGEAGTGEAITKLVAEAEKPGSYSKLIATKETDPTAKAEYDELKKKGAEQFLAALHFEGLNSKVYQELKREVHNGWLIGGQETMPKSQDQTMLLCDRFHKSGGPLIAQQKSKPGVAMLQQGEEKSGKPRRKPSCYHCGEPHRVRDCPLIDSNRKDAIMAQKREK